MSLNGSILVPDEIRAYSFSNGWNSDSYPTGGPSMSWTYGEVRMNIYGGSRGPSDIRIQASRDGELNYFKDGTDTMYTVNLVKDTNTFLCNTARFEGMFS